MTYKKAIFSLPEPLIKQLSKYADTIADGNKSRFVAEAVQEKIARLRGAVRRTKLRDAYQSTAEHGLSVAEEWGVLDDKLWEELDEKGKQKK